MADTRQELGQQLYVCKRSFEPHLRDDHDGERCNVPVTWSGLGQERGQPVPSKVGALIDWLDAEIARLTADDTPTPEPAE